LFHDAVYRDRIRKHVAPGDRVLDAGCGRHLQFSKELADRAQVVGIDIEPRLATDNLGSPFGVTGDVSQLPFPSDCFDVVISRSVIEHLQNPLKAFQEFYRVLRPGGKVILLTPNKYDYVSLIAAITPYRLHRTLISKIFRVSEDDVFPTLYRANTVSTLRKKLNAAGLIEEDLTTINHYPAYLMFSAVLFRLGVVYERLTSLDAFHSLRGSILCVFQKPGTVTQELLGRHNSGVPTTFEVM
jgi:ubiquinone/menaquinone biosynthesis C-methylase UbiE